MLHKRTYINILCPKYYINLKIISPNVSSLINILHVVFFSVHFEYGCFITFLFYSYKLIFSVSAVLINYKKVLLEKSPYEFSICGAGEANATKLEIKTTVFRLT